jgi:hypothetical protein
MVTLKPNPNEAHMLKFGISLERAVFTLPSATADIVLPALDEIGALMASVNV